MSERPQTMTGRLLAAFLRGLLPETRQFEAQIAAIEAEAGGLDVERLARAIHVADIAGCHSVDPVGKQTAPEPHGFDHDDARRLAAEYDRLTEAAVPEDPE